MAQDDGLAQRLASEIRSALPGAVVTVPDPYGLDIAYGGQTLSVGIGSVYTACARSILTCDTAIQQYALRAASHMLERAPLTRDQLRIVVRSSGYLDALRAQGASQEFVSEPLAGELRSACYRDLPQGRRPIQVTDLPTLQLNSSATLALCKDNSAHALAPLASRWNALPDQGIGIIRDTDDITAYLAAHGDWRPLAEQLGDLIVAVPSIDTLLYSQGSNAIQIDALATLATSLHTGASMPVSAQVFRWTESGWIEVRR